MGKRATVTPKRSQKPANEREREIQSYGPGLNAGLCFKKFFGLFSASKPFASRRTALFCI